MLYHRPKACLAFLGLAAVALHSSCSTKAVGVEECRDIEYARCRAAPHCPDQFDVSDVEQCRLYYRDHCLHGMALASPPNASSVKECIDRIDTLATCAEADRDTSIVDCEVESLRPKITNVCKLLAMPEAIPQCAFLTSDVAATGGQSGTGGQTGAGGTSSGGTSADSSGEGGIIDLLGVGGLF